MNGMCFQTLGAGSLGCLQQPRPATIQNPPPPTVNKKRQQHFLTTTTMNTTENEGSPQVCAGVAPHPAPCSNTHGDPS
eukprot:6492450-Amphidinium_carterae.4